MRLVKPLSQLPIQLFRLSILFLGSILAHEIGGGNFVQTKLLLVELVLISMALFAIRNVDLSGPTLALVVVITQSASHFILGAADRTGEISMTFSHVLAGVVTYKFISGLESMWDFLATLLGTFFSVPVFKSLKLQSENQFTIQVGSVRLVLSLSPVS